MENQKHTESMKNDQKTIDLEPLNTRQSDVRLLEPAHFLQKHEEENNKLGLNRNKNGGRLDSQDKVSDITQQMETSMKVLKLISDSCFTMTQINGQRLLGPPPGWNGPAPGPSCEVFVGKIPRDLYEDDLYPVFRSVGEIYEIRLMMDFSGTNRGYCFVMYTTQEYAKRAVRELDQFEIRPGFKIGVVHSINNCRLYIAQLPPFITTETIVKKFYEITEDVENVAVYRMQNNQIHYVLVSYKTHRSAAMARRRLVPETANLFRGTEVVVEWADPNVSPSNVLEECGVCDENGKVHIKKTFIRFSNHKTRNVGRKFAKDNGSRISVLSRKSDKGNRSLSPIGPPRNQKNRSKNASLSNFMKIPNIRNSIESQPRILLPQKVHDSYQSLARSRMEFIQMTDNSRSKENLTQVSRDINDNITDTFQQPFNKTITNSNQFATPTSNTHNAVNDTGFSYFQNQPRDYSIWDNPVQPLENKLMTDKISGVTNDVAYSPIPLPPNQKFIGLNHTNNLSNQTNFSADMYENSYRQSQNYLARNTLPNPTTPRISPTYVNNGGNITLIQQIPNNSADQNEICNNNTHQGVMKYVRDNDMQNYLNIPQNGINCVNLNFAEYNQIQLNQIPNSYAIPYPNSRVILQDINNQKFYRDNKIIYPQGQSIYYNYSRVPQENLVPGFITNEQNYYNVQDFSNQRPVYHNCVKTAVPANMYHEQVLLNSFDQMNHDFTSNQGSCIVPQMRKRYIYARRDDR